MIRHLSISLAVLFAFSSPALAESYSKKKTAKLHILSIGIGKCGDQTSPCFSKDAINVSKAFETNGAKAFSKVIPHVLIDENATKRNIQSALNDIANDSNEDDSFVLFYSAASRRVDKDFVFTPYSADGKDFISQDELGLAVAANRSKHRLLILDSPFSSQVVGKVGSHLTYGKSSPAYVVGLAHDRVQEVDNDGTQLAKLCVSGLGGDADLSGNGTITAWELARFLEIEISRSLAKHPVRQPGTVDIYGGDAWNFVLVDLNANFTQKASSGPAWLPKRQNYALLVANSNYRDPSFPKLKSPIKDIKKIEKVLLEKYGWKVKTLENPGNREVFDWIQSLIHSPEKIDSEASKFDDEDELFIYFAGHGVYDDKGTREGYLIMNDSDTKQPYRNSCIGYSELQTWLDQSDCKHILLSIHACYGGTFIDAVKKKHQAPRVTQGDNQEDDGNISIETAQAQLGKYVSRHVMAGGSKLVIDHPDGSTFADKIVEQLENPNAKKYVTGTDLESAIKMIKPDGGIASWFGADSPNSNFIFVPITQHLRAKRLEYEYLDFVRD